MQIFDELGTRVAMAWSRTRSESDALPHIAAEELDRAPLYRVTDYTAILNWLTTTTALPFQANIDLRFGEPPLTLYWHPAFYIEALFWCSGTTAIHGHGFSGAFQVLSGTSVQSLFEFESTDTNMRFRVGRLKQKNVAILRPGTTQAIHNGERFVHSVFHLGYPSVTIVVRTRGGGPQHRYYRPGIAVIDDIKFDHLTTRLLQVSTLQATILSSELTNTVRRIGQECELAAAFQLLQTLHPILFAQKRPEVFGDVIMTLATGHGLATISRLSESLTLELRLKRLMQARETVHGEELRLFLALLLTQQERAFIMAEAARFVDSDKPSERIARWIGELAATGVLNVPSDEATKRLVAMWLEYGRETACCTNSAAESGAVIDRRVRDMLSEPLLAPLLRDSPS